MLLCDYHHRLVHEAGWRLDGDPNTNQLCFIDPAGRRHPCPLPGADTAPAASPIDDVAAGAGRHATQAPAHAPTRPDAHDPAVAGATSSQAGPARRAAGTAPDELVLFADTG